MSEQAKIMEQMQEIIMKILQSGSATVEEGDRLDELEELLFKQKCFQSSEHPDHSYIGEEIATFLFNKQNDLAIEKLCEHKIVPEDFFGFAEYHYDEDDSTDMFTQDFIQELSTSYKKRCEFEEK